MNARTYAATVRRVLAQLVADRRTLALILAVPTALLTLLYFVYRDCPGAAALFNHVAVSMMAMLPMIVMFLVTSVTMLRERGSGTLERLWTTPWASPSSCARWPPGSSTSRSPPPGPGSS